MLTSEGVRTGEKTGCFAQMYRGKRSVIDIVEEYKDFTLEELEARIRGGHMEDTGSCSESCEVFPTY